MFFALLKNLTDPKLPNGIIPSDLFRVKIINYTIAFPIIAAFILLVKALLNSEPGYPFPIVLIIIMILLIIANNSKHHYYAKAILFIVTSLGILAHGYLFGPALRMDLNYIVLIALTYGAYDSVRVKYLISVWCVSGFILYHFIANDDAPLASHADSRDQYLIIILIAIVTSLIIHFYFQEQVINLKKQQELNKSLISNNKKLKAAISSIQDRNLIFQSIGHDLRTPAAAFNKLSQKINHLINSGDIDRLKILGNQFESSGNKISYLIQNILNWANSEVEDYTLQMNTINLNKYTTASITVYQILAKEKGIEIINSIPPDHHVDSDINYLAIIINNVLHNAIKYSHPNSIINITTNQSNNFTTLSIIDYGIGMPDSQLAQIKADAQIRSQKGTNHETGYGLGMKTCYKIADKLGLHLDIQSTINEGTTVTLKFPR